jgi:hypothetical protein
MIAWKSIYGSWLAVSPVGPQIRWWDPHLVDILFSSRNGLFSLVARPLPRRDRPGMFAAMRPALGVPMIASVALMTYFNASVQDWWGSAGFGGRRFDGTIPLFVVGVATFGSWAARRSPRHPARVVAAAGLLLAAWNLALMSAAHEGVIRIGESVSFGDTSAAQARTLHGWFGNPFTYPVSLGFAMRNGSRRQPTTCWASTASSATRCSRTAASTSATGRRLARSADGRVAREATAIVPLDHATNLLVQVRARAFNYPGAPPQRLRIVVNGHEQPAQGVDNDWGTVVFAVDAGTWRAGVNRVRLVFDRAARPVDVGWAATPAVSRPRSTTSGSRP